MSKIVDLDAYRERRTDSADVHMSALPDNAIVISMLDNGDHAFELRGAFRRSRRLTAQAVVKFLDRILDD